MEKYIELDDGPKLQCKLVKERQAKVMTIMKVREIEKRSRWALVSN